jgi:phosphoglycolate phosphatase
VNNVLFDLDGTITDPREGITRSIAYAIERMGGEPPPLEELLFAIGPPLRPSLAQLLKTDSREAVERALAFYRERFTDTGIYENAVYEGIPEALGALQASGATLLVATSKPQVFAERILRHFALDTHFLAIHGSELDGTRDDKRELFAHLLPHHGFAPAQAVMIGDRGVDMIAARHHGVAALGALWGYGSPEELEKGGAQRLCARAVDLPAAIREWPAAPI